MKETTIDIPIYQCKLTIVLDKDLSYVEKKYGTKSLSDYGAVTMRVPDKFSEYIMAFEYSDGTIIAHEIVHLKNYIYEDRCIKLDVDNDENEALLTGWLFEQIETFLEKQNEGYSEENMKEAFNVGFNVGYNDETSPSYLTFEKFIEQFKNK